MHIPEFFTLFKLFQWEKDIFSGKSRVGSPSMDIKFIFTKIRCLLEPMDLLQLASLRDARFASASGGVNKGHGVKDH